MQIQVAWRHVREHYSVVAPGPIIWKAEMGGWWLICSRKMALPSLCTACTHDSTATVGIELMSHLIWGSRGQLLRGANAWYTCFHARVQLQPGRHVVEARTDAVISTLVIQ